MWCSFQISAFECLKYLLQLPVKKLKLYKLQLVVVKIQTVSPLYHLLVKNLNLLICHRLFKKRCCFQAPSSISNRKSSVQFFSSYNKPQLLPNIFFGAFY